jgi:hypothetical protein
MLDNSDFYTGAFPAEFGNAYSGVFDLRLRNGNKHKREYSVMAGLLGTDITAEGPFQKDGNASYLLNYRYSTLAMLNTIGIKISGDEVPTFQNSSFKINIPTEKAGTFNLFGLAGLSNSEYDREDYKFQFNSDLAVAGLSHSIPLNDNTILKTVLAYTGSRNLWEYRDSISPDNFLLKSVEKFRYNNFTLSAYLNSKINASHSYKIGATITKRYYNVQGKYWNTDEKPGFLETVVDRKGDTETLQAYFSWKYRITQNLTLIPGIHYNHLFLNNNHSIEPRAALRFDLNDKQSLNFGFGVHSKVEALTSYLVQQTDETGNLFYPNRNMEFSKARHYVLGYDWLINKNLVFKTEVYYQDLYNIPIEDKPESSFSTLNASDGFTNKKLVNQGTGKNYGIDLTLEKFFHQGYYFMATGSVFDSKYTAMDKVERNTRYNTNHILNLAGGKEWQIKNNGVESTLALNMRFLWSGGYRYSPIDIVASKEYGYTKFYEDLLFSEQRDDILRVDIKLQYRKNKKKTTRIWELDVQNATGQANIIDQYWDDKKQKIEDVTQLGIVPVLSYRIEF